MAKAEQRRIKTHRICQPLPERCREETLQWRIRITSRRMGFRKITILPIRKTNSTILGPPSPRTTTKKTNKQFSVRLTRWLDRLNHFNISLKHTSGKEIMFTDFISRNPTEKPEPEKNYEEELVINAIAQLATVNARIGRIFNQSDTENAVNKTSMHDTRTLFDTRHC